MLLGHDLELPWVTHYLPCSSATGKPAELPAHSGGNKSFWQVQKLLPAKEALLVGTGA